MSTEKLKIYNDWVGRVLKEGGKLAEYPCPCCGFLLHSYMPSEAERVYDTLAICPNCDGMHFRIVRSDGQVVAGERVESRAEEVPHAQAD